MKVKTAHACYSDIDFVGKTISLLMTPEFNPARTGTKPRQVYRRQENSHWAPRPN